MLSHAKILLILFLLWSGSHAYAQDLEPRRWSHLPSDINFIGMASSYYSGDILFDPVLKIEDATFNLATFGVSYIRTFGFFGKSARVDLTAPFAKGKWEGLLDGQPAMVKRQGLADPVLRFSVNLYGAPALKGKEYARFRAENPVNTTVGAGIAVTAPLGEYSNERLINLGANRWVFQPQVGVLHQREKWQFELTGSVFLFGGDNDFLGGIGRDQNPLWFIQGHVIRTFRPGLWASFSTGYGYGGPSTVNGVQKLDDVRASYWAIGMGVPINPTQGLKFVYLANDTNTRFGSNQDIFRVAWSIMFGH